MTNQETSVSKTVTVNAPREHVFEVFTRRFDSWWPRTHKIGKAELASAVLEQREGGRWYDPDPAKASRLEVSFHAEGPTRTRVELVHSELDRHGEGWEKVRDSVGSPGGWSGILGSFAKTADATGG